LLDHTRSAQFEWTFITFFSIDLDWAICRYCSAWKMMDIIQLRVNVKTRVIELISGRIKYPISSMSQMYASWFVWST
jgi:hypothetical protein